MSLLSEVVAGAILVGGDWRPGGGGSREVRSPATGELLISAGLASMNDVGLAAEQAAQAQRSWASAPAAHRAAVLRRAGQLWEEHAEEIMGWNMREVGAPRPMAGFGVHVAAAECYEAAALASSPRGEVLVSEDERLSLTEQVPVGVVGVISPFNVPIILGIRAVAPALALGNSVLLKPDPRSIVTGGVILARVFEEAGLPAGVLQLVPGGADIGAALVAHPRVRVVAFTGSTAAGRSVGALAAEHLTRVHLELGGNSAFIVRADADIGRAVGLAEWGSYLHQGQICMSIGRHLVHESIYERYVAALAARADSLRVGDTTLEGVQVGPLIDSDQIARVQALVDDAVGRGARVRAGGTSEGNLYRPTVLTDVPLDAPAYCDEVFGPVAVVVPFRDDDDAARLAADSPYGLSLGIVTADALAGLELARRIPSGIVHINDQTVNDEANAPFGGVGASGNGARHGGAAANVAAFTETRWVTMRREIPLRSL